MTSGPYADTRPLPFQALVERAAALADHGGRVLLGIVGAPGAGKSTLAEAVVQALDDRAVLVPMDGFHLADPELVRLGRHERKGAIDTFDAAGFVHLLRRLLDEGEDVVYAPVFVREQEQAVAGALPVPRDVPLVVTEGNYLLADGAFAPVRELLTESWYVDIDPAVRRDRLRARHMRHGRSPEQAAERTDGSDERNAAVIEATRSRADLVLRLGD